MMIDRINDFQNAPPPKDWDGLCNLKIKCFLTMGLKKKSFTRSIYRQRR